MSLLRYAYDHYYSAFEKYQKVLFSQGGENCLYFFSFLNFFYNNLSFIKTQKKRRKKIFSRFQ